LSRSDALFSGRKLLGISSRSLPKPPPGNGDECYNGVMENVKRLDKPEPRWQAILALMAVGGIYTALPRELSVGPRWLLFVVVVTLLVPAAVAHRAGRQSLNHLLGIVTNGVLTVALTGSLALLVANLPSKKEDPRMLLLSAASIWLTNVITFALWYWRLDGGGPSARRNQGVYTDHAFLFPQSQINPEDRGALGVANWSPGFLDYLFVAFNTSAALSPADTPVLEPWAKLLNMVQSLISLTVVVVLVSRGVGVL
jgi:hypothetical protein